MQSLNDKLAVWLPPGYHRYIKIIFLIIFGFLFCINSIIYLGCDFASGLDNSWRWAINVLPYDTSIVFGRDVAFTFGPLGYLLAPLPYGNNLYHTLALNIISTILLISLFILYAKKNGLNRLLVFAVIWLVLLIMPPVLREWSITFVILFTIITIWEYRPNNRVVLTLSVITGLLSAITLMMKFSLAICVIGASGLLGIAFLVYDTKNFLKYFLSFSIPYLAVVLLSIIIVFKGFFNFKNWLLLSWDIASGYNTAMAIAGPLFYVCLGVLIIGLMIFLAIKARKNSNFLILTIIALFVLFLAFKHGFVRQDGHMLSFFCLAPYLAGLLDLYAPRSLVKTTLVLFVLVSVLCTIYVLPIFKSKLFFTKETFSNIAAITSLSDRKNNARQNLPVLMANDILPAEWNNHIGDKVIHILPWELTYAPANNWTGWKPNPIIQTYSAYTQKLDLKSAEAYTGALKPELIFFEFYGIDQRNLYLDTPVTWNTIIANYTVVKNDGQRALLNKKSDATPFNPQPLASGRYKSEQWIPIPSSGKPIYAKIEIEESLFGKMTKTIFRLIPPDMDVQYADGSIQTFRIIPDTVKSLTLMSHIPGNLQQMLTLFDEKYEPPFEVTAIKFSNMNPLHYRSKIKIEWFQAENKNHNENIQEKLIEIPMDSIVAQNDIDWVNFTDDRMIVYTGGGDPYVIFAPFDTETITEAILIDFEEISTPTVLQFFYTIDGVDFNEDNSTFIQINHPGIYIAKIPDDKYINFRIDFGYAPYQKFVINRFGLIPE